MNSSVPHVTSTRSLGPRRRGWPPTRHPPAPPADSGHQRFAASPPSLPGHPLPLHFQKLLWASCHASDTPMINFDFHQFAKGGKLEKLENLLRPQLKLHWDDFDVFAKGENVSPR